MPCSARFVGRESPVGRLSNADGGNEMPNLIAGTSAPGRRAIAHSSRAESDRFARFSLTIGGPLYRLYQRSRLLDPPIEQLERRLIAVAVVTWLPLFLLSLADEKAFGGTRIPFVLDLNVQTRFIVALPMLIAAEPLVHRWMRTIVRQFVDRGIVLRGDLSRFDADHRQHRSHAQLRCRRGSVLRHLEPGELFDSSRSVGGASRHLVSRARRGRAGAPQRRGMVVLARQPQRVSVRALTLVLPSGDLVQLPMAHVATDAPIEPASSRSGRRLGFLGRSMTALSLVFVAQTITIAGEIGGRVFQDGVKIDRFVPDIIGFPLFFALLAIAPLAFFSGALVRAGFHGALEYGELASQYVDHFRQTWMAGRRPPPEPLLGSADIQSLADLSNAFEVVRGIQVLPVGFRSVLALIIATALPFLPLALSVVPLTELIRRVLERAI